MTTSDDRRIHVPTVSVKNGLPIRIIGSQKTHLNLRPRVFLLGEIRKLIHGEITTFGGLEILAKASAEEFTEYKHLANVVSIRRRIVLVPVMQSDEAQSANL